MKKIYVLISMLSLVLISITFASVFVYYPLSMNASPQSPAIELQAGSNAGQPDIGQGKIITVSIGNNASSASITIHPTYQRNYYKDVLRISNVDDTAFNVYFVVNSLSNSLPTGSVVKVFVYEGSAKIAELDMTNPSTGTPISIGSINSGKTWQLDFYVYIPEGYSITGKSYGASLNLVYTPSSETPPVNPASGR